MADKNSTLDELRVEQKNAESAIDKILDAVGDGTFTKSQLDEIASHEKEIDEIQNRASEMQELGQKSEDARKRAAERRKAAGQPVERPGQSRTGRDGDEKTIGEHFVKQVESYINSLKAGDGQVSEHRRVESGGVAVPGLAKAIITGLSDTSAGAFVTPDRYQPVTNRDPFRILTLRDLLTVGTTTSDTVEYVLITGHTNNAAPVAEATDSTGTSGTPGQSTLATAVESVTVKDISHYVTMTKRSIADAGQMQTYVNNFLLYGIADKAERLMVSGDGTGENFKGILNATGLGTQAYSTDRLTSVRKARTQLKKKSVTPTAVLMNSSAWEAFDLTKDNEGSFYFGGPTVLGNPRVWGMNVVENEAIPDDKALIGDYRYAAIWDRLAAELTMSDSPENYFLRKLVAIMGSFRAAFAVLFPGAFVEVDLVSGT